MKEELIIRTNCHPEANGRKARIGDVGYELRFPMEDGRELVVKFGTAGYEVLSQLLLDMMTEAPSYTDGSTNFRPPES